MDTVSYLLGKKTGGTPTVLQDKEVNITENGEQTIRADSGYDALRSVDVTTNVQPDLESKSVTISTNTTTTITPTTGKDGLSSVEVTTNVPQPTGTININANGTYNVTNYATAEVQTPSITPEAPEKDVNFYDYDGKRVYSYTKSEFLALNEYPANPTHQGLTAQGWNWDYQDAVNYVTEYGILDVGQMYITDDGATRITVEIPEYRTSVELCLCLNGSAEINWGDNSQVEIMTGTSTSTLVSLSHNFVKGHYIISITPIDNCKIAFYYNWGTRGILTGINDVAKEAILNYIKEINIGSNVEIKDYAFYGIYDLKLSMPDYIRVFNGRNIITNPKTLIFPKGLRAMSQYTINLSNNYPYITRIITNYDISHSIFTDNNCLYISYAQQRITISDKLDGINNGMKLPGVINFIVPKNVASIQELPLDSCKVLDFSHHTSIPTLGSSSAFGSGFPSDCQIVVPDSLYEDWIAANNWTNYASQIISKSDFDNQ